MRKTPLAHFGAVLVLFLVAGCIAAKAITYDTIINFEGKTYLVQEYRFSDQVNTTLFEMKDGQRSDVVTTYERAVIHFTDEENDLGGVKALDTSIKEAEADGRTTHAKLLRIVRFGERQGDSVITAKDGYRPVTAGGGDTVPATLRRNPDEEGE